MGEEIVSHMLEQLEFLGRLILAGLCGGFIGYERKNRMKNAGPRTHFIVCLASALMMITSKYGFFDLFKYGDVGLDPSRVAAQIVSGVGFLGAGMIFIHRQSVTGLTTAAGVWATAGVGMAIGAGMYFMGVCSTVLIIFIQLLLHKKFRIFRSITADRICIRMHYNNDAITNLKQWFNDNQITILNFKTESIENGELDVEVTVQLPKNYNRENLLNLHRDVEEVESIEI
mgnify:CR=1 FL=1